MTMHSEKFYQTGEGTSALSVDNIRVVIPTLNAAGDLPALLPALAEQGLPREHYLIVDSQSTDGSPEAFRQFGATVVEIDRRTFNHGGTRQRAVEMVPDADVVVMMTQDAIPWRDDSIRRLAAAFANPRVGMAYGRQLPRPVARGIERHARLMNYPIKSEVRSLEDRKNIGVKTVFCSDSFAAYRPVALKEAGGFPEDAFFAEDQLVAGQMLLNGWHLSYCGDAEVIHSHGYSLAEEFKRYFDVGVFHGRNAWLIDAFGSAEGEGIKFVKSELNYLFHQDIFQIPSAILRTLAKYAGYKLGNHETLLPRKWKQHLSTQPFYWRSRD